MLPKAVLYDWDATLADNWGAILAAMNHTLAYFGQTPWGPDEARQRIKQSLRNAFPALFGDRWQEAREVYYGHFSAHHLDNLKPMAGAAELLDAFAVRGVYQAVVSNKSGKYLCAEAAALGWTGRFGRLVGANDAERDKPDPAPVRLALENTGIVPGSEVWFVGDTDIDIQCARNSGLTGILIPPVWEQGKDTYTSIDRAPSPDMTFSSCAELSTLVPRLRKAI